MLHHMIKVQILDLILRRMDFLVRILEIGFDDKS